MHLQRLSIQQDYTLNLEAFTQAALILFLAVAIVLSNVLIIAALLHYRGLYIDTVLCIVCVQSIRVDVEIVNYVARWNI